METLTSNGFVQVVTPTIMSRGLLAKMTIDLADVYMNVDDSIEAALDRCKHVSLYLLEGAPKWLDEF